MNNMNGPELIQKLNARYACKAFDSVKKINDKDFEVLEEVLRLSPSSFGLQLWKFIIVKDSTLKEKLKPHSWNQEQITSCSHLICICTKTDATATEVDSHINNIASTRNVTLDSLDDYKNRMTGFVSDPNFKPLTAHWAAKQGYIALGFLMEAAAILGIDSCPMEGFDAAAYNELLGINGTGFTTTVLCPVGYRSDKDGYQNAKKVRFSKENVIEYR